MGSKRLRNVEKRQAKANGLRTESLMPKAKFMPLGSATVVQSRNEDIHPVRTQFYSALSRMSAGFGDVTALQLLFSRLMFGRRMAYEFFTDDVAEEMHNGVYIMIVTAHEQGNREFGMKIPKEEADAIHSYLHAIDDMTNLVTSKEYQKTALLVSKEATDMANQFTAVNLKTWEEFKQTEHWYFET